MEAESFPLGGRIQKLAYEFAFEQFMSVLIDRPKVINITNNIGSEFIPNFFLILLY
jgi:hypothetical protein